MNMLFVGLLQYLLHATLDRVWHAKDVVAIPERAMFTGPGITVGNPHKLLFHPSTGLCVIRKSLLEPLKLDPCSLSDGWNYTPQKILSVKGTYFCIQAVKEGMPATLSILCSNPNSKWDMISDSKLHLSSKINSGSTNVCLDVNDNNIIVTNACK
ncbi:cellulase (glycosyl hydrolase family 5), putative [Medicago truncatula]|uniref:Cellulase (Glycosyl hydrolase family 5), putative n=1 Tax=Medicago truncatula TaxID=3880 RepID=A0A072TV62_MEDTR|nr:cellulase (glycosyl hydrolase family 5), putative [Medicago truncatula]